MKVPSFMSSLTGLLAHTICILGLVLLSGCSGTKFLKDNESFYTGATIKIEARGDVKNQKNLRKKLEEYLTPKPNSTILGSRPGVWFYFVAGKKDKGIGKWIKKKLGHPPVLITDATPDRTAKVLQGQLYNHGFFSANVKAAVQTKNKKSNILYTTNVSTPYRIKELTYQAAEDSAYAKIIRKVKSESLVKAKQRYNLDRMKAEQQRIEAYVQNYGYYYFDDRYLLFEADSTLGKRMVALDLTLEKDMPAKARRVYRLDEIKVFPDYTLTSDTIAAKVDTIKIDGYTYYDNKHDFRPHVITDAINLIKDSVYARNDRELTLSHLMSLGTFKFVNIKFSDSPRDSASLNASVFLTPLLKKSLRAEIQAVSKSNNFVGPGANLTFTNRNFFKGAELFKLKLSGGYESQISRQQTGAINSIELGIEGSITVPRFITPISILYSSKKYLPNTEFKGGYTLQQRINYFRLNSLTTSFGYKWRESTSKSHLFYPAEITYVETSKKSDAFNEILKTNQALTQAFENQFIPGLRYSFTLNTQLADQSPDKFTDATIKTSNFYFNSNIDIAGNLLHATQSLTEGKHSDPYTLFGSPYSQYVKGDVDFRYYLQFDKHQKLATRIIAGVGYAYGNSKVLPYIKQFSIGGSNSIRAFPARSVGPGLYNRKNPPNGEAQQGNTFFIDQRGDIKLEGNIEYRFDMIKFLKGAVFVDGGNIWLMRKDDENRPGGEFDKNKFLKQLAVGTGFGLRFDFSFFVLRFDLGIPVRRPYLPDPWVIKDFNIGSSAWRRDNLLLNIAIGYPF